MKFKLLNDILHKEKCDCIWREKICSNQSNYKAFGIFEFASILVTKVDNRGAASSVSHFVTSNRTIADASTNPKLVCRKSLVRLNRKSISERKLPFHQILIFSNE